MTTHPPSRSGVAPKKWDPLKADECVKSFTTLMVTSLDEIDSAKQTWGGDLELESQFVCTVQFFRETTKCEGDAADLVAAGDAAARRFAAPLRGSSVPPTPAAAAVPAAPGFGEWQRPEGAAWERARTWPYRFALETVDFVNSEKILGAHDMEVWGLVQLLPPPPPPAAAVAPAARICKVYIVQRVHTTFSQLFDFRSFPLDRQTLTLVLQMRSPMWQFASEAELGSCAWLAGRQGFSQFKRPSSCISPILSAWEVFNTIEMGTGLSSEDDSRGKSVYSRAVFKITVARKWHHYAWQVLMPYMLLTLAVFAAVAPVGPEHVGERQLNTVALLFSSVGLRYILRDFLPDATSDTLLEHFVTFSLLFFLLSAAGVGLVYKFPSHSLELGGESEYHQGDFIFWLALFDLWLAGHLLFFWRAWTAWVVQQKPVGKQSGGGAEVGPHSEHGRARRGQPSVSGRLHCARARAPRAISFGRCANHPPPPPSPHARSPQPAETIERGWWTEHSAAASTGLGSPAVEQTSLRFSPPRAPQALQSPSFRFTHTRVLLESPRSLPQGSAALTPAAEEEKEEE